VREQGHWYRHKIARVYIYVCSVLIEYSIILKASIPHPLTKPPSVLPIFPYSSPKSLSSSRPTLLQPDIKPKLLVQSSSTPAINTLRSGSTSYERAGTCEDAYRWRVVESGRRGRGSDNWDDEVPVSMGTAWGNELKSLGCVPRWNVASEVSKRSR
jgi:hypothetical protein